MAAAALGCFGGPLTLVKATLNIEMDRELFNSWCSIGTASNMTTNSQIARYLILCYWTYDKSETKKKCETCGAMLTLHCAPCSNEKSSQDAKSTKQLWEKCQGPNKPNPGQTMQITVNVGSLTNRNNAVYSDLDYVIDQNEPVGGIGYNDTEHDLVTDHVAMLPPLKESGTNPTLVSQELTGMIQNCNCNPAAQQLMQGMYLSKESEPKSKLHGSSPETDISPGGLKQPVTKTTEEKHKKNTSFFKTFVEDGLHLSSKTINANKDKFKNKFNKHKQQCKQTARKVLILPKACAIPLTALHTGEAVSDNNNIFIVCSNKPVQPQTKKQSPVKTVSFFEKNYCVPGPVLNAAKASSVNNGIVDLGEEKPVEGTLSEESVKILSLLKNTASVPFTKYSADCNTVPLTKHSTSNAPVPITKYSLPCDTEPLTKCSASNETKTDSDMSMQESSKQVPVILLSCRKESVTVPSFQSESAYVVQNAESKQLSERGQQQTMQNPGQSIVKMKSLTSDTVHSDSDCVENEPADCFVSDQNVLRNQTQRCYLELLPPFARRDASPSSKNQAKLVNCGDSKSPSQQEKQSLSKNICLLKKSDATSMLHGAGQVTDVNLGDVKLVKEQTEQKLKRKRSVLKTSVKDNIYLSNNTAQSNRSNLKMKLVQQHCKQAAQKILILPKACTPLPSTAVPDCNAICDKNNLSDIVCSNKPFQSQTKQQTPVKIVSLFKKNDSLPAHLLDAVNTSNVNNGMINLCEEKSVGGVFDRNSANIHSLLRKSAPVPFTKYFTKDLRSNETEADGDKYVQEGSKQDPVILLSLLKESVTVPSSQSESADVVGTSQAIQDPKIKSDKKCYILSSSMLLPTHFATVNDKNLNHRQTKQTPLPEVVLEKLSNTPGKTREAIINNPVIGGNDDNVIYMESGSQQKDSIGIGYMQQPNSSVSGAAEMKDVSDRGVSSTNSDGHGCRNTNNKSYCDLCKKTFANAQNLRSHRSTIHSKFKPFQCDICGKTYATGSKLRSHQLVHSNVNRHQCDLCQKSFMTLKKLKLHSAIPSGLKSSDCEVCCSGFSDTPSMQMHTQMVHSELRRFLCSICGMAYNRPRMLRNHMMKHPVPLPEVLLKNTIPTSSGGTEDAITVLGGKADCNVIYLQSGSQQNVSVGVGNIQQKNPSLCPGAAEMKDVSNCGASDITSVGHWCQSTSNMPRCGICKKIFATASYLQMHKDTAHYPLRPFHCDICGNMYTSQYKLWSHKRFHSGLKPFEMCGQTHAVAKFSGHTN